ncbi:MAG TPA: ADP-ribose pyrophosphatase [Firmicutes bacterium]|nr:ADP-ribose pyrophosphatase [Bacillota bacterium]
MNDELLNCVIRLQSLAQAGLTYAKDPFDKERYLEIRQIASKLLSLKTDVPLKKIEGLFCNESGYQTPKVDTRAALFKNDAILLVHENNGTWALPGGWCDVDQSIASNTVKEVKEETGLFVKAKRLIAIEDWRKHNVTNYVYGVLKCFVLCEYLEGSFSPNNETTETSFFKEDELPSNLAKEKTTKGQILMCFRSYRNPSLPTFFD